MEKETRAGRFLKMHMIDEYASRFRDSSSVFVTEFRGLTDKELNSLKKRLKQTSCSYLIVKNSLCRLAMERLKLRTVADMIDGCCALGYGRGDPVSISKVLVGFSKDNKNLRLKGGYIDGQIITPETIIELAALPPRGVLLARLVSCINSPITGFVLSLSGVVKKLLYALNEIVKKRKTND